MKKKPIKFGPFPHEMVERTLEIELAAGGVYCSAQAQIHIEKKHPGDSPLILQHMKRIVEAPTWVGQSPRHNDSIEFVKRIKVQEQEEGGVVIREYHALLAVSLERDQYGDYRIESGYTISEEDVTPRRLKNRLLSPK